MRTPWAVLVLAAALALESWVRGYLPGDPDGVAGRMGNVISLDAIAAGLAAVSLLPLGVARLILMSLATTALLAALAYRIGLL